MKPCIPAALLLSLAACATERTALNTRTPEAAAPGASAPADGPAVASAQTTLAGLVPGDRACYVSLVEDGAEHSLEGDFDLCPEGSKDATALIGKAVTYTTKTANVLAAECQGDMDCGKSDEVQLVVEIRPVP